MVWATDDSNDDEGDDDDDDHVEDDDACMPCDLLQRAPLCRGTEARSHALAS